MRYSELIEMAMPTDDIKNKTFYHGTPREPNAKNILINGIKPGNTASNLKQGDLAPVLDKVYLTDELSYAIIYALGGDYAGHDSPLNDKLPRNKKGKYGYLFIIPGNLLVQDIQPDEDSVGSAVHDAHDIINKNSAGEKYYGNSNTYKYFKSNPFYARNFLDFAKRILTPKQYTKIITGEYSAWAAGGKKMLEKMSDGMKLKFIELGAHVAYAGNIMPSEAWRIDKTKSKELKRDGSNFFDIAEKIK